MGVTLTVAQPRAVQRSNRYATTVFPRRVIAAITARHCLRRDHAASVQRRRHRRYPLP